jgi:hypothetical protein
VSSWAEINENNIVLRVLAYKVDVSGTTVTLTAATGNNIAYTVASSVGAIYMSPTSRTTFVVDSLNLAIKTFINYDPSTNTLTSGNRTSQTSQITDVLIPNMLTSSDPSFGSYTVQNNNSAYLVVASNSKIIFNSKVATVTNPGTATVTVSNPTYSIKSFPSTQYSTESTGAGIVNYYAVSGTNYYSIYSGGFYNFDPTNTNFNFNRANITLPGNQNYFTSASEIVSLTVSTLTATSVNIACNIVTPATPFVL